MAIAIVSAGCITPIGLSLAETAAAARARVARLQEIEWRDRRFEPFIVGVVPDDGLPELAPELAEAPLQYREARMLRLAHAALAEALAPLPPDAPPLPVLLGLPEQHTTLPLDGGRFIERLALQSGAPLDLTASVAAARGRAAGLMALRQARARIEAGTPWVLVGGVDSLVDLYVLGTLDLHGRVRGETNGDGFSPAEGAAFLLLADADAATAAGCTPLATLAGSALGKEAGHLYADEPYLGEGLAGAVSALLGETPPSAPLATIYSSFNGERYWAKEFGVARIRNAAQFDDAAQMEHPAECFGDLGAAHGPVLAALAAHGLAGGYRRGPCLVYASSDYGDRAAALLEAR
jgi:3-oxoacyl-[acyl-carrier-protein] synthase-1